MFLTLVMQIDIPTQVNMWIWWRLVSSTRLKWLEQPYWMLQGPLSTFHLYTWMFLVQQDSQADWSS